MSQPIDIYNPQTFIDYPSWDYNCPLCHSWHPIPSHFTQDLNRVWHANNWYLANGMLNRLAEAADLTNNRSPLQLSTQLLLSILQDGSLIRELSNGVHRPGHVSSYPASPSAQHNQYLTAEQRLLALYNLVHQPREAALGALNLLNLSYEMTVGERQDQHLDAGPVVPFNPFARLRPQHPLLGNTASTGAPSSRSLMYAEIAEILRVDEHEVVNSSSQRTPTVQSRPGTSQHQQSAGDEFVLDDWVHVPASPRGAFLRADLSSEACPPPTFAGVSSGNGAVGGNEGMRHFAGENTSTNPNINPFLSLPGQTINPRDLQIRSSFGTVMPTLTSPPRLTQTGAGRRYVEMDMEGMVASSFEGNVAAYDGAMLDRAGETGYWEGDGQEEDEEVREMVRRWGFWGW